jgi:aspartate aminotransferase-like enzyme
MKLFTPGPTSIHPEILKAMSTEMLNHRSEPFRELLRRTRSKARELLVAKSGRVFFFTSGSTGCMEASVRCLVERAVLHTTQGYFSENWHRLSKGNGIACDAIAKKWGEGIHPEELDAALKTGHYDTVAFTHCETSTGVMNPIEKIAAVVKKYPDVLFVVDCVSTLGGIDIQPEKLGIDLLFAGVQKCLGCPPGFTLTYVSDRAFERAAKKSGRGYYFDILRYRDFDDKDETTETPSVSHFFALDKSLERILAEGREKRFKKHLDLAKLVRSWGLERGFEFFPEKGYESISVTCFKNTRHIDVFKLNDELGKRGYMISEGLGPIRGKTFRIAHMGEMTRTDYKGLLPTIDKIVGDYSRPKIGTLSH